MMIRNATISDVTAISECIRSSSTEAEMTDGSQEGIDDWIALSSTAEILERVESRERNFVAVEGDLIVGYISFKRSSHLSLLFVREGFKRKGIGRDLFLTASCGLPEITLNSSDVAVPFYLSLGFQRTGERFLFRGAWSTPMKKIYDTQQGAQPDAFGAG